MLSGNTRRWVRHPFHEQIRVSYGGEHGGTIVEGRGVQLSQGGICLFAAANLPLDTKIQIEFQSAGQESLRIPGKVRNRQVYLYGIEFIADRLEDRRSLAWLGEEFCKNLSV